MKHELIIAGVATLAVGILYIRYRQTKTQGDTSVINTIKSSLGVQNTLKQLEQAPRQLSDTFTLFGKPLNETGVFERLRTPLVQSRKSMGSGSTTTTVQNSLLPTDFINHTLGINPYTNELIQTGQGLQESAMKDATKQVQETNNVAVAKNQGFIDKYQNIGDGNPLFNPVGAILKKFRIGS